MSFHNSRGAWTAHSMTITKVEVREGRKAWVSPIVVHLEDERGTIRHTYGAAWQGQAKRDLGEPVEDAVGEKRVVHLGINCQVVRLERE